jgi:hypothetical protein
VKLLNNGVAVSMRHEGDEQRPSWLVKLQSLSLPARLTSDWGSIR